METDKYESPFNTRYASKEMSYLFSEDKKFRTWRKLWVALAETEKELGLPITQEQIEELKKYQDHINYDVAVAREKEVRHDVMAHVYAYGEQAKIAKPIIHLGATSCYVGDNTDILIYREALLLLRKKVISIIAALSDFAMKYREMPTLGFTHFQPAQLTTVGKRATLWIQDLLFDVDQIDHLLGDMKLLGSKGTTGTQASFMELFNGDSEKVKALDEKIGGKLGFSQVYPVSGQTYPRKLDALILSVLSQIAQSCHKFANDLRLLQHLKEVEEPFESSQIGSSAMAYKRNPMRAERMTGLSRFIIANMQNGAMTAAQQWFERTLDDSANKRLAMAEGFLAADSVLMIYLNVAGGLVVYPQVIHKRIMEELPFMATENIIMDCVKHGGDRQELHEAIRVHSMAAAKAVKTEGRENDLLKRIAADPRFPMDETALAGVMEPEKYVGRAPEQVKEFIEGHVRPLLESAGDIITQSPLRV